MNVDDLITQFDRGLRTVLGPAVSMRPVPGADLDEPAIEARERQLAAALMRVNHSGEVSAQALYMGQGLVARNRKTRQMLQHSAQEENEHLAWCEARIQALGGRKSLLNPLWYAGSFAIGAAAALLGDQVSMGFLAETEHQVVQHLERHLEKLPAADVKSEAVLRQMKRDEAQHEKTAQEHGAARLPRPVQLAMRLTSKVMTETAFRL